MAANDEYAHSDGRKELTMMDRDDLYSDETNRLYRLWQERRLCVTDGKRRRKVYYVPSQGFGAAAGIRVSLFKRIEVCAAGRNVFENLIRELRCRGWEICE